MRRAPIFAGATAVGLSALLSFHTRPANLTLGTLPASSSVAAPKRSATTAPPSSSPTSTSNPPASPSSSATTTPPTTTTRAPTTTTTPTTTTPTTTTPTTTTPTTTTPTTTTPNGARSATGPSVNYNYGVLSVKVSVDGSKITGVTIASLDDGGNFRSASIDQQSIPLLEQQALAAQSANIQGVSGATYTSAGFAQSLQGALTSLGL